MTSRDETEALSVAGEPSGALERHSSGEVSTKRPGAVDTAEEPSPDNRPHTRDLETSLTAEPATAPDTASDDGSDDGSDGGTPTGSGRRRRPLRTSLIALAAITVTAAAGVAATGAIGGDGNDSGGSAPSGPPATAKVERTTLTDTETVDGNLGYGDATTVQAPASASGTGEGQSGQDQSGQGQSGQSDQSGQGTSGAGSAGDGIVTWVPEEGKRIERGDTVYRVDQQRIPLLYGSFPLYRTLRSGSEGDDVEMLEKNLRALGYTGFTVDETYNSATAEAVKEWQDDLNREETGTVAAGDAVVADGARRVADVKASPGAALSGSVLSWTGTERIVGVDLDVQFEDLVEKGTEVTVELPDNTTVQAEVTDIGTPSTSKGDDSADGSGSGDSGSGDSDDKATLPVELTVKDQKGLGRYQAAAVQVTLKAESRKDVLVVPVSALVAQRGGGYAVEVVTADGTEYRPVKLGMFADSKVEVSGKGIKEGTVVGVPK
ncbi:peptidoglycan-binding protein [Streptomyces sp. NPDC020607]|uniref:peptidoglycan-binding protein n=1 Tax=Streptomyces sp. NPDC020607 TaxID=3365082 RepID=UPI00379EC9FA